MSSVVKKQDLPPAGGYKPLNFKRIPAKSVINAPMLILGSLASTFIAAFFYRKNYKEVMMEDTEKISAMIALHPLLFAERDRAFLKQLRANRDEENRLMKNVEGWVTGYYYSEPLYKTIPKDTFLPVPFYEFYVHNSQKDMDDRRYEFMYH